MTPRPPLPRPTRADVAGALIVAGLAAWLELSAGPPGVGAAFLGIILAVVNVAKKIWDISRGVVTWALKWIIEGLRWGLNNAIKMIVSGLKASAVYVARTLGTFWRWLDRGLRALFGALDHALRWLHGTLDRIFGPLINAIRIVKDYIRAFYDYFVRPILDIIDAVQAGLRVLAFLGVDWARELDRKLSQLEQMILFPLEWITSKINELVNWINRIVTLDGLLQRVMLLRSLIRDVSYTNNLWWNSQSRPLSPLEELRYKLKPRKAAETFPITAVRQHFATGDSEVSGGIRESIAQARQILRDAGGL